MPQRFPFVLPPAASLSFFVFHLFITFGLVTAGLAQDKFGTGYYVTPDHDTVRGYIKYTDNFYGSFTYRAALKSDSQELSTTVASGFGFDQGNAFEAIDVVNAGQRQTAYARKIVQGEINLYRYHSKFYAGPATKKYFVITSSKGGSATERNAMNIQNQGAINALFFDCPHVLAEAKASPMDEEHLVKLLTAYHQCKARPFKLYVAERRSRVEFGVNISWNVAKLTVDDQVLESNNLVLRSGSLGVGGIMILKPSRRHSSIFHVQLELLYNQMHASGSSHLKWTEVANRVTLQRDYYVYDDTVTVDAQRLSPRLGFKISGRSNVLNPYIMFGITGPSILSSKSSMYSRYQVNGDVTVTKSEPIERGIGGVFFAAGIKKPLPNGSALFAECVLEYEGYNPLGIVKSVCPRVGLIF